MRDDTPTSTPPEPDRRLLAGGPGYWLATGLGVGLSPIMPGTIGALWGLPLAYGLGLVPSAIGELVAIAVLALVGVPICASAARRLGKKDPGAVVFDEIVAMPVALFGHAADDPAVLAVGFLFFRLFDILKPPPVRQVERLPDGWGIMADDLVAGVYANLCLWLASWSGLLSAIGGS